jgi:hypothetical protein
MNFEQELTGGHPNPLGNTVAVVNKVLENKDAFDELFHCYFSNDEVVRLRVSNAMKRICKEKPEWLVPYIDRFLSDIARINQASTQWTLAQLMLWLESDLTPAQKAKATTHFKYVLEANSDWIVQNTVIETLGVWAQQDAHLKAWLIPHLEEFSKTGRKSVAGRANKMLAKLQAKD